MIIFVNDRNEIKDVNSSNDTTLKEIILSDKENPFENWSIAKICCYRVGLAPETITEVAGTEEITYTDLEGNEVTETREITETKETGKYFISMMTPYVDSRIIEHIEQLGNQTEENADGIEINGLGLFDVADVADQNNTAIFELADYIADLMERVEALEGGV